MSSLPPKKVDGLRSYGDEEGSYMASPKGAGKFTKPVKKKPKEEKSLKRVRRRLSVTSDNKLIEGFSEGAADFDKLDKTEFGDSHCVTLFSGISKKGYAPYNPAKKNQDSLLMVEDSAKTKAIFLGTLDGHGEAGDFVSQYIRDRLPEAVFQHPKFPENPGQAMTDALAKIESSLIDDRSIDTDFSGTTVVIATVIGNILTVCNVGDSRLILARQNKEGGALKAVPVSIDHKPDDPEERKRIVNAGGRVFAVEYDDGIDGPARVWLAHSDIPGLAMSRSLGDGIAHTAGVTSTPDIYTVELTPEDKFLICATDGLWEFMTNQECVDMAAKHESPRKAVEALVQEASGRWMREENVVDDTTVIVALLDAKA